MGKTNDGVLSKCCNSTIRIGRFESWCDKCGNSVNPDSGEPYEVKVSSGSYGN